MKPIHITIGIILMFGTIILANIVTYEAIDTIFNLTAVNSNFIEILLVILSFSFFAALLIGMRHYNLFSRIFYFFSALWFGFFIYFFLISTVYLILSFISDGDNTLLGGLMIIIIILLSFYGAINTRKLYVKKVKIKLPNLPLEWEGKKAVWISDAHIGLIYGKKYIQKIVNKINELNPDIVFIGGDLFDGISLPVVINFANPLKKLVAPLGVYFVAGNHEQYGDINLFYEKVKSLGIEIIKNEIIDVKGIQIIGIEYSKNTKKERFRKVLKDLNIDKSKTSILLKHEPSDLKIAEDAGINFQISGHTHNAQQWPLNYYAKLIYKKFTYGLNYHGKMIVYTSSGVGTWGPPIRIGSKCEIVLFNLEK